jgi:hypothetical protein
MQEAIIVKWVRLDKGVWNISRETGRFLWGQMRVSLMRKVRP